MDLSKQPPRRPTNTRMVGIVGLARMTDKARADRDETLGEYKYGANSGLDREVLEFIEMQPDEFADLASELDDEALESEITERLQRSGEEIASFNRGYLELEPQDDLHRRLLKERVARYAPGSTEITTVLQSIELDDWGSFRDRDLTQRPPRSPYLRSVAEVVTLARMADKARAFKIGKIGDYKYGENSGFDRRAMEFLGIDVDAFTEAAYENPNDGELGEWVRSQTHRAVTEISIFNAERTRFGLPGQGRERLNLLRSRLCPERVEIDRVFDLIDYDDQNSFGIVDLNRRPPRSPFDTGVCGLTGLARMIDKARAVRSDTLGQYWFGDESGIDWAVLEFLGLTQDEFLEGLDNGETDEAMAGWLGARLNKPEEEIVEFNRELQNRGPSNEGQWRFLRNAVAHLDSTRNDIQSFTALTLLDDQIYFARFRAPV